MNNEWYPPQRPRAVEGGLKARSARGVIAQTWWSGRFVQVLEDIGVGNRLQRGRHYARRGQVISLDVDAGSVTAQVQGSRARPYRVRIGIAAYGKPEWATLERALADNAWYTAKLLDGEMPEDIEDIFAGVGLPLFPTATGQLSMDCSCPDSAVPCKHLAAAFYLLAEAFDEDPFTILAWRGREKDDLLANLRAARSDGAPAADDAEQIGPPLTDCLDSYFVPQAELLRSNPPRTASTALLNQLPPVDLAVRGHAVPALLQPAYVALGERGASLFGDANSPARELRIALGRCHAEVQSLLDDYGATEPRVSEPDDDEPVVLVDLDDMDREDLAALSEDLSDLLGIEVNVRG